MLIQLPEEKREVIIPLFKGRQQNLSALWCYFTGRMPGKAYVDDLENPKKAICVLDMSWTYISDDADFEWIEQTVREIIRTQWLQIIWVPERGSKTPLPQFSKVIPRYEFTQRNKIDQKTVDCEIASFSSDLYDQLPWKSFHESVYGTKENFLNKTFGFYGMENGQVCSEAEASFIEHGYSEIGIITVEDKRRKGYAFASCLKLLDEMDKRGLKPIWACDEENVASKKLAEKLGFINPVYYYFLYFPTKND